MYRWSPRPLQRAFEPVVRRCQRSCLFVIRSREIKPALLLVKPAAVGVDVSVVRPQLECLRIFCKRLLWAVHRAEDVAAANVNPGDRAVAAAHHFLFVRFLLHAFNPFVVSIASKSHRLRIIGERLLVAAEVFQHVSASHERVESFEGIWVVLQCRCKILQRVVIPA